MKILYLTPGCFDKGGVSRYNRYQINALREHYGVENIKVLSLFSADEHAIEEEFSVTWSGSGASLKSKIAFAQKAMSIALSWRPAVIHAAHINLSGLAHFLSRASGSKSVLNIYGREVWSPLSIDAQYGFKRSDKLIADCHFTANYTIDAGIRATQDIDVIWDCIDLNQFKVTPVSVDMISKYGLPEREGCFIIGTLGRLSQTAMHKGYDRLIKVVGELFAEGNLNLRLVIAGRGDMLNSLRDLTREAGIEDIVTFTGSVHEDDMAAMYSHFDVFSLVSDRELGRGEGIPLTPLEAMGCGVPVIVGNQDGSQEAVIDGKNGYVVDPFDLHAHKACLLEMQNDQSVYNAKAKNAFMLSRSTFSFEIFKAKTIASYISLNG